MVRVRRAAVRPARLSRAGDRRAARGAWLRQAPAAGRSASAARPVRDVARDPTQRRAVRGRGRADRRGVADARARGRATASRRRRRGGAGGRVHRGRARVTIVSSRGPRRTRSVVLRAQRAPPVTANRVRVDARATAGCAVVQLVLVRLDVPGRRISTSARVHRRQHGGLPGSLPRGIRRVRDGSRRHSRVRPPLWHRAVLDEAGASGAVRAAEARFPSGVRPHAGGRARGGRSAVPRGRRRDRRRSGRVPRSSRSVRADLGLALWRAGRFDEALRILDAALAERELPLLHFRRALALPRCRAPTKRRLRLRARWRWTRDSRRPRIGSVDCVERDVRHLRASRPVAARSARAAFARSFNSRPSSSATQKMGGQRADATRCRSARRSHAWACTMPAFCPRGRLSRTPAPPRAAPRPAWRR